MKKLLFLTVLLATGSLFAQDIHFSQFYNSPLTLNPALTGKINGKYRIGAIYRNQWFGPVNGKTAFSTPSVSFDMPIRFKKDVLGVGAYFVGDRSSEGKLKNNIFMASVAYHKALGKSNNHSLSLGVQAGYCQKQLDASSIRWASQFDDQQTYNPNNPGETFANNSAGAFDMNLGLLYNGKFSDRFKMYLGGSVFHLLTPEQNFANGSKDGVPMRMVGHGGFDIGLSEKISLLPSVIYMTQANASETNAGLSLGINAAKETTFYIGAYYRVKDAVIPYVGLDLKGFRLGLSYDINASELNNTNGSMEISLMYIGKYVAMPDVNPALYCPRF
jgi:type IX secretion system PorP/SprF family membrane protein